MSFLQIEIADKLATKPELAKSTEKKMKKVVKKKRRAETKEPNRNIPSTSRRTKYN